MSSKHQWIENQGRNAAREKQTRLAASISEGEIQERCVPERILSQNRPKSGLDPPIFPELPTLDDEIRLNEL